MTQRGEHQGKALTAPRGHHAIVLGVPRTYKRDLSTHTWAPRHVWCAPRGCNGTGPGVAYLLSTQARGRLNLVRWASWGSHGRNAMAWWGTIQQLTRTHDAYAQHRNTMAWLVAMELDLTVEASNTPRPWTPRHGMGSHINVGKAHWCTRHLVNWLVHTVWFRRLWAKTRWWALGHKRHLAGKEATC